MGKLILHTGPSDRYYFFKDKILTHIKSDQAGAFIYLLPVNRAVRYFKKQVTYDSPAGILIDPNIYTYSSMMSYIYRRLPAQRKIISNTMRLVLLNQILREKKIDFKYFNLGGINSLGLVNKIDGMLTEFCEFGYKPEDFRNTPITSEEKYHDFAQLLNALYEKFNSQLIDEPTMIMEVVDRFDEKFFKKLFPEVTVIYINGYGIYTPPMLQFLKKVKQWCAIEIKIDYNSNNKSLFQHTLPAFEALGKFADEINAYHKEEQPLYNNLFKTIYPLPDRKTKNKFQLQKAKNRREEVAFIAATIKKKFHEQNIPLHEIGVTFPDIELNAPLIHTIFKEYDIPYNLSTGFSLAQSPLIQSYLKVLKTVIKGFDVDDIHDLMVSPFINVFSPIKPSIFRQITKRLRPGQLNENWIKSMQSFLIYYQRENENDSDRNKIILNEGKIILEQLPEIITRFKVLAKKQPAQQLHAEYLNILVELGMLNWYERNTEFLSREEREKEFRAFNRFIKLLNQLTWILKFAYGDRKIDLSEYYQYLLLAIRDATYNIREWSNYGVQILPRLEIQSLELRILFVGGLTEGKFPRQFTRDIFFNDSERQLMGLNASEDLLDQDRFLFYQLLSSSTEQVILSYPAFEDDISLLPSTFISNLQDVSELYESKSDIAEEFLLSGKNVTEYIAKGLKAGVDENHEHLFQHWLEPEKKVVALYWLDAVDTMVDKTSRRLITKFEGNVSFNSTILDILKKTHSKKPVSITALESYAFCPMQYFLQRVLQLQEEEEVETTLSALERGLLVHKILFRFFSRLKQDGAQTRPWEHRNLLHEIAGEEFENMPYSGMLWILEKERYFGSGGRPGLWDTFLQIEQQEIERTGFKPRYFEVSFGRTGSGLNQDEISSNFPMIVKRFSKEIKISGKIDRIDCDEEGKAIVYDYKTGSINQFSVNKVYSGSSLQLPLYLEYVNQGLRQKEKRYKPVAGIYYQVKDGAECKRKVLFADRENARELTAKGYGSLPNKKFEDQGKPINFSQMIDRSLKYVFQYVEDLNNGKFIHTRDPKDRRCSSYCSFSKICRKDVAKILAMNDTFEI